MSDIRPAGAVFRRCALQVNSHHYAPTFRGQPTDGDAQSHAEAIVAKALDAGVSVLAITDHNDVSGVEAFRAAADRDIAIFPGFELTSSEGIHVLCIYPPDTDEQQLGRYLGAFGIDRIAPSSDLSNKTLEDLLATVRIQGGLPIAAHVTGDNGLYKVLSGQARIKAWRSEHLLAVQIPGSIEDLPQDVRQILTNKNPDYRRDHPVGERLAIAAVNARDVYKPEHLDEPSATCDIKMSEVSIEGLRQAFMDPESRIRLNPRDGELKSEQHAELVSVAWEGGFLDGVEMRLNPNLNVLVGGRGTGKSTIVESLRYALALDPVGEQARQAHQGIVQQVLRSGTKISVRARCHRPIPSDYLIDRIVPNQPVVCDENGQISNLRPVDILHGLEVYGQHEISELTRSPEKLTSLLDRFVKPDKQLSRRKIDLRQELGKTRRELSDVRTELSQIEEKLDTLPGLEETLERFRDAGLEELLRERTLLVREERVLDAVPERLASIHEYLNGLRQDVPIDRVFLSPKALEDLPGKEILAGLDEVLERLSGDIDRVVGALEGALARADESIAEIRARWVLREREVQADYEKTLRRLQRDAVNAEEFIQLQRRIEGLRPLRERRSLLKRLENEHLERRRALLVEWEEVKAAEFRLLDRAASKVSKALLNHVQVEVAAAGNREPLVELLREELSGRLSEAFACLREARDFSLSTFVNSCRSGSDAVQETYDAPRAQSQILANASEETLMLIEELELPATTAIQLNTAPAGDPSSWRALEDLSVGQKATAVLLLLLLESEAPLIVDQPEDDLDNRFITEGVIPRMRGEKGRRQFIFSTHNANIPVLGDAELILGLTATGEAGGGSARITPDHTGSIDSQTVRELVEDLLEGGKEAFEIRRLKYGF